MINFANIWNDRNAKWKCARARERDVAEDIENSADVMLEKIETQWYFEDCT